MKQLRVIAMVCSAGGLDALTRVLSMLPAQLPAAVVVLQHRDPTFSGPLIELLAARTQLVVAQALDGDSLSAGQVLVAPAGHHVLITKERKVALIVSGAIPPSRPSADLLLATLALAVEEQAIAVVLSGRGLDGATGATAVHRFGGLVIASDEASSTEFGMPGATIHREGIVDHVADVDDIAQLLIDIVGTTASGLPPRSV